MSEKDDYVDKELPPPWFVRFLLRRVLPAGVIVLVVGVALVVILVSKMTDRHYNTHRTISDADIAVRTLYQIRIANGKYPAKLTDVSPSAEIKHNDAWGDPFRYTVVTNELGEQEAYVWSERTRGGKTTLRGAKVKADGTVIKFGMPDD